MKRTWETLYIKPWTFTIRRILGRWHMSIRNETGRYVFAIVLDEDE